MIFSSVFIVLFALCAIIIVDSEITTNSAANKNRKRRSVDENDNPEARTLHKIKKLRKRMLLLCSLGLGRNSRISDEERNLEQARFFFPSIQQIANLQVTTGGGQITDEGGDDADYGDESDGQANGGWNNCDYLMQGAGLLTPFPAHVFLNGLTLARGRPNNIRIQEKRLKRKLDRQLMKPVRKTVNSVNYWLRDWVR